MRSKEDQVLKSFFNSSRYWHFEELLKKANIGRPQLAKWLRVFEKQGIIKRFKKKGKMPYYTHNFNSLKFRSMKKIFAYRELTESGLLEHLASLHHVSVVILFGSFSRGDWYEDSDIDIFIFGKDDEFEQGKYELKLKREIQLHNARNAKDLKKMDKLLPYVLSGDFIKGSIQDLGVRIYAKT